MNELNRLQLNIGIVKFQGFIILNDYRWNLLDLMSLYFNKGCFKIR